MLPNISVIIPAYIDNTDKLNWLQECLRSIESQNYQEWEAIIIDDHSPVVIDYLKTVFTSDKYRWVRTTRKQGPALCRNTGVALARGEAIFPLDADDLLFDDRTLESMYDVWVQDKNKIIYGDIQKYENVGGTFRPTKEFKLPEYSFKNVLDLNGIIPVSAMHSRDCWEKSGGWKAQLEFGLEDVEYWISAGKAGYCGQRLPQTILLYRKHENSRSYNLRRVNRQEINTRNIIIQMHEDVFSGRYPVGCCGGGSIASIGSYPSGGGGGTAQSSMAPGNLDQYAMDDKIWVEYMGRRNAVFGVVGPSTNITYKVHGPGYQFEIHKSDVQKFRNSGRGQDFQLGIASPNELVPIEVQENGFKADKPELGEIFMLDAIASNQNNVHASSDTLNNTPENQLEAAYKLTNAPITNIPTERALDQLNLTESIQDILEMEGWTIETLASAHQTDLLYYKGVGPKRADTIIEKAKEYANLSVPVQ